MKKNLITIIASFMTLILFINCGNNDGNNKSKNKIFIKVAIIFTLFVSLISCSNGKKNFSSENYIDISQKSQVSVLDFFDSIDVVQLETNDSCLISNITKVIFSNNRYYILDVRQQIVLCFDSSGKFLFKINQKGQGPREYLYLAEFNIDTFNNQLLLLEPFGHLLVFDLDGRFIEKIRLPKEIVAYNEVYPLSKENLGFISLNEYQLVYYSKIKNGITDKKYRMNPETSGGFFRISAYTYNDSVYFYFPLTNNIIDVTGNIIFSWNFGSRNNTNNQINKFKEVIKSENSGSGRDYIGEGKLNYKIERNYETSRFRICILDLGRFNFRHIFFDKKENQSFIFEKTKENINFSVLPDFYGEHIIMYDKGIPKPKTNDPSLDEILNKLLVYYNRELLSEDQKKIIDTRNEDDNPFLIKYNFKQ